ncbi:MAG: FMN-binding protein, partial [Gemmatimonadaceae bacterium]|nr:FMN-binding protein [Gemmatimonadaceae bacterium]
SAPVATPPASAPAPTPAPSAPTGAPAAPHADSAKTVGWRDGTYTGWGTSRHGDIEATVVVENGKITGAIISRCLTRYSCSWVAHLQAQVVARQSPEVDNVSGATQSANAFYYAVVDALAKAK